MKKTFNIPTDRIEEFTSPMVNGESLVVYHLYIDGNYSGTFTSKDAVINNLYERIKISMGVYWYDYFKDQISGTSGDHSRSEYHYTES